MELTAESIKADIQAFNGRIDSALDQLSRLPATAPTLKERKKISLTRGRLLSEIDHVKRIREYAMDALHGLETRSPKGI